MSYILEALQQLNTMKLLTESEKKKFNQQKCNNNDLDYIGQFDNYVVYEALNMDQFMVDVKNRYFYFINSNSLDREYTVIVYPEVYHNLKIVVGNNLITSANFEIYNTIKGGIIDYGAMNKLPLDKLPVDIEIKMIPIDKK